MQISNHYLPYPKKTFVVVTNNELAKILCAHEREMEEKEVLEEEGAYVDERSSGTPNDGPPNLDEMRHQTRQRLYKKVNKRLMELLKKESVDIILCAPEAHKNELTEEMHPDVIKAVVEVVPKNLASLPLDAILRILQETRA